MIISQCCDYPILESCSLDAFNYQIDPYVGCEHNCHYCYVLPEARTDWTQQIFIHGECIPRLSRALADIPPQTIYMGYHTDPYQPREAELFQTRAILKLLLEKGFSASILTKSDLVLRDKDILGRMKDAGVSVSVAFNLDRHRKLFEGRTMETERRIEALAVLKQAGIRTGALLCPVVPRITEPVSLLKALAPCADTIWVYGLGFSGQGGQNRLNVENILTRHFPDLAQSVMQALVSREHPSWQDIREEIACFNKDTTLDLRVRL